MEQEKPEVVIMADPPIPVTPATGSKGAAEEEKLMEIVESESEKQPELEKLTEQIKEMKEKIEILEKEKYGKAAIELAKQLENINSEEEATSEEPFIEVMSETGSDEEDPGANAGRAPTDDNVYKTYKNEYENQCEWRNASPFLRNCSKND
uniref:Uncharacterized protein n=1 Tax=Romanomermis culicivorax TaxID=13658 RepID=A0A915HM00_ROMCU